ncbi:hypothetical protein NLG97_g7311 [Lecanicillium saksenae]|uniref:Uncharacterized protein n=1 Tax=Lecanicillium saksenae TaxID=468837 RepID=A0ACC1QNF4_9HYPO|nr:hypothetical protein NLG97_g7311 [Lecanicillium saksenae]
MAPPQQPNKNEYPDPAAFFEQMMAGFDPTRSGVTGRGVDHNGSDNTTYPTFWPGFPFGRPPHPPAPPGPPGSDHPRPPSPPSPPSGPEPPHPPHPCPMLHKATEDLIALLLAAC